MQFNVYNLILYSICICHIYIIFVYMQFNVYNLILYTIMYMSYLYYIYLYAMMTKY